MKYFYGRQHIDNNDIKSTLRVLKSNFLTQGPTVSNFEKKLKKNLALNMLLLFQAVLQHYIFWQKLLTGAKKI